MVGLAWWGELGSAGEGSFTNFQIKKPRRIPGRPTTKKAARQPKRAAICAVKTGARAKPTKAPALTTMPMLRPRFLGSEAASIMAVIMGQVGPSATPMAVRARNRPIKERISPETQDNMDNRNTAGMRMGRRPMRSERAPKMRPEAAHAMAKAAASRPT